MFWFFYLFILFSSPLPMTLTFENSILFNFLVETFNKQIKLDLLYLDLMVWNVKIAVVVVLVVWVLMKKVQHCLPRLIGEFYFTFIVINYLLTFY